MIGGYVGVVVFGEDPHYKDKNLRNFLRVRIILDLRKALVGGFGCQDRRSWEEALVIVREDWEEAAFVRRKKLESIARRLKEQSLLKDEEPKVVEEDLFTIKIHRSAATRKVVELTQGMQGAESPVVTALKPNRTLLEKPKKRFHHGKPRLSPSGAPEEGTEDVCGQADTHVESSRSPVVPQGSGSRELDDNLPNTLKENTVNPLAIVPYSGKALNEVICGISALGLKRVKARVRKTAKRKIRGEKENIPEEDCPGDEAMEDAREPHAEATDFVFKAKRGRKKKCLAEGEVSRRPQRSSDLKQTGFNMWILMIVRKSWNEGAGVLDDKILDLIRRLDSCRKGLMVWNREEFPHFQKLIVQLRGQLADCYGGPMTAGKLLEAERLVKQIEETLDREETYWWKGLGFLG
ncbi:hypothetical protein K1719_042988 [Acacia pycnantha]|nr:hypothetical protein K1719_042988 [Acacia pycnantha]